MPIPIKTEAEFSVPYKFIEWMITDKCNYDCSFCGDENKIGARGRLDLETNKKIVDAIAAACKGSPYWVQLTGGEPTIYPKLIELLSYLKEKGAMIKLVSNGSRSLRWWEEIRDRRLIDTLFISYHSQQHADYEHLANVINLFQEEETVTIILATYVKETVDLVLEGCAYLKANTGALLCINAMDIDAEFMDSIIETGKFDQINKYTWVSGDLITTKTKSKFPIKMLISPEIKITYDDSSIEVGNMSHFMKVGKNKFLGWQCDIGLETMKIEIDKIYRGGCRVGGKEFSLTNIKFWDKPITCPKAGCWCGTDMYFTKIKNIPT
jgi:organic radical activating enzyme